MNIENQDICKRKCTELIPLSILSDLLKSKLKLSNECDINILHLKRGDIFKILQLTPAEQFNRGLYDLHIILNLDPDCFYILVKGNNSSTDDIIATLMFLNIDHETAVIGFYFIKPEYRKLGIALEFFKTVMPVYAFKNLSINAVEHMVNKYEYFFPSICEWKINVYRGKLKSEKLRTQNSENISVVPFSVCFLSKVIEYDTQIGIRSRKKFLTSWLLDSHSTAVIALINGGVCGYGILRQGQLTPKVSPLFADSLSIAESLLANLKMRFSPKEELTVSIQCPNKNKEAMKLIQDHDLIHIETVVKMYSKSVVPIQLEKIYSFTSLDVSLY